MALRGSATRNRHAYKETKERGLDPTLTHNVGVEVHVVYDDLDVLAGHRRLPADGSVVLLRVLYGGRLLRLLLLRLLLLLLRLLLLLLHGLQRLLLRLLLLLLLGHLLLLHVADAAPAAAGKRVPAAPVLRPQVADVRSAVENEYYYILH